jgi:catalase
LRNVAEELAQAVADGLGMDLPEPLPRALGSTPAPEVDESPALSLMSRPGETGIQTRRIAILVADGVSGSGIVDLHQQLAAQGAVPHFVGIQLGAITTLEDETIEVEIPMEAGPAVLYDALVLPDGQEGIAALVQSGHAMEFVKDQYRHCKPILVLGAAKALLVKAGIPEHLPSGEADSGLLYFDVKKNGAAVTAFVEAITRHRHYERETDPPTV